ncbi:MAG TPA: hypothetical protein VLH15_01690, partial [Dehalococcoidales bacterium]|nr:hypothetical protein [Dehalococcoidales bacterium]
MPDFKTGSKFIRPDGPVAAIVSRQPLPKMGLIRQKFDAYNIKSIEAETKSRLERRGTLERIKPGQRIAVTAGSRGIANISLITKTVINEIKRMGGRPFIVPSMGSHGGATSQGQLEILATYGITETEMDCPILASMETQPIGFTDSGKAVHLATTAVEADGIVVVGRI